MNHKLQTGIVKQIELILLEFDVGSLDFLELFFILQKVSIVFIQGILNEVDVELLIFHIGVSVALYVIQPGSLQILYFVVQQTIIVSRNLQEVLVDVRLVGYEFIKGLVDLASKIFGVRFFLLFLNGYYLFEPLDGLLNKVLLVLIIKFNFQALKLLNLFHYFFIFICDQI